MHLSSIDVEYDNEYILCTSSQAGTNLFIDEVLNIVNLIKLLSSLQVNKFLSKGET